MLLRIAAFATCLPLVLGLWACAPTDSDASVVLGDTAESGAGASASQAVTSDAIRGSVAAGEYALFELGVGSSGQRLRIVPDGRFQGPFVTALFDQDMNLLTRVYMNSRAELEHVLRLDSDQVFFGVAAPQGGSGGDFNMRLERSAAETPSPAAHKVWLNFGDGTGIVIHGSSGVSFSAFDASHLGSEYAGQTQLIKQTIIDTVRADYADYDIAILTSDTDAQPAEPHSVVHFGGTDPSLLGLADNVDGYNQNPSEQAIVYTGTFSAYRVLELSPEEMGVMIGNVASHELGHLLGLYHTTNVEDVMDTTGTAFDLAKAQVFSRAALEPSVFPTGMENSPELLKQTLGLAPENAKLPAQAARAKLAVHLRARQLASAELKHACGTCVHLDK